MFKTALFACSHIIASKVHGDPKAASHVTVRIRRWNVPEVRLRCPHGILQLRSNWRACSVVPTLEVFENGKVRKKVAGVLEKSMAKSLTIRSARQMLFGQSNDS